MYGIDPIIFSSCGSEPEQRIRLDNAGNHVVILSPPSTGLLTSLRCGIRVAGGLGQNKIDTLRIEAFSSAGALGGSQSSLAAAARIASTPLTWKVGEGVIQVWESETNTNYALIQFSQFERVQIEFAAGGSEVSIQQSTAPAEMTLSFPFPSPAALASASASSSTTSLNRNIVRIASATYPLFLNGSIDDVYMGVAQSDNVQPVPLSSIHAPIILSSHSLYTPATSYTNVHIESVGKHAPLFAYAMDSVCLSMSAATPSTHLPSVWMKEIMTTSGFGAGDVERDCQVFYSGLFVDI